MYKFEPFPSTHPLTYPPKQSAEERCRALDGTSGNKFSAVWFKFSWETTRIWG